MVKVEIEGFDKLLRGFAKKHVQDLIRREVGRQLRRTGETLRKNSIRYIDTQRHGVPNSPLTVLLKGSSKPLVDRGDLRQSIEARFKHLRGIDMKTEVGANRRANGADIAWSLHEGFTLKVTPELREQVFAAIKKRRGKVRIPKQTGKPKKVWRIKGRPFLRVPFEELEGRAKLNIAYGVKRVVDQL